MSHHRTPKENGLVGRGRRRRRRGKGRGRTHLEVSPPWDFSFPVHRENLENTNGNEILRPEQRKIMSSKFAGTDYFTKKEDIKDKRLMKETEPSQNTIDQPDQENQINGEKPLITRNKTDENDGPTRI